MNQNNIFGTTTDELDYLAENENWDFTDDDGEKWKFLEGGYAEPLNFATNVVDEIEFGEEITVAKELKVVEAVLDYLKSNSVADLLCLISEIV